MVEKCIPNEKPEIENQEKKEERVNAILEKHAKILTYAEWILAERLKHQQQSRVEEPITETAPSSDPNVNRTLSASELSQRLASSPKEDEVWATDCAVCLAEFEEEEKVRELPCEHIFHHDCIHDWFMKAKAAACPLCRNLLHSGLSTDNIMPEQVPPPAEAPAQPPPPIPEVTQVETV